MTPQELLFLVFHAHQMRKLISSAKKSGSEFHPVKQVRPLGSGLHVVAEITDLKNVPILTLGIRVPPGHPNPGAAADAVAQEFFFKGKYEALPVCFPDDGCRLHVYTSFSIPSPKEVAEHVKARVGANPGSTPTHSSERTETYVHGDQSSGPKPK